MRLTIWRDIGVRIKVKEVHIHKRRGISHKDFCKTWGDIPIAEITEDNKVIGVCNTRGRAYAARKRLMYRKGYNRVKTKGEINE